MPRGMGPGRTPERGGPRARTDAGADDAADASRREETPVAHRQGRCPRGSEHSARAGRCEVHGASR